MQIKDFRTDLGTLEVQVGLQSRTCAGWSMGVPDSTGASSSLGRIQRLGNGMRPHKKPIE